MPHNMQAALYDDKECAVEPTIRMQASPQALDVTGNSHLLRMPAAFLPQCAALQVNGQETNYQIQLQKNKKIEQTDVPYLQLSTYLQDQCAIEPDFQISLIADGSVHPIGSFTSEQIAKLNQYFNPDIVQTQVVHDDSTPFDVYYRASCAGTISLFSTASAVDGSELMTIPLEQFMNTCFSPATPFPGFQSSELGARSQVQALDQIISGMLTSVSSTQNGAADDLRTRAMQPQTQGRRWAKAVQPQGRRWAKAVQPQTQGRRWAKDEDISTLEADERLRAVKPQTQGGRRWAKDEEISDLVGDDRLRAVKPQTQGGRRWTKGVQPQSFGRRWAKDDLQVSSTDHVGELFKGMSEHLRTRSEQGLPISFKLTCSSSNAELFPPVADEVFGPGALHPEPRPHPRPHPHPHGFDQYMAPHNQSIALIILGLLATMVVVRTFIYGKKEQSATSTMQQRPVEKNKDYVAVPSNAC